MIYKKQKSFFCVKKEGYIEKESLAYAAQAKKLFFIYQLASLQQNTIVLKLYKLHIKYTSES